MKLDSNTILITGGASGIGLAMAERFLAAGSKVILCSRKEDKLREAKDKHPEFITRRCDVALQAERIALFEWAVREFPRLNVLVNNAGIQRRVNSRLRKNGNRRARRLPSIWKRLFISRGSSSRTWQSRSARRS